MRSFAAGDSFLTDTPTAAALLLSVQATEASDPAGLADWLLRVLAVLSPDGIPRALLDGLPRVRPGRRLAVSRRRGHRRRDWGPCSPGETLVGYRV